MNIKTAQEAIEAILAAIPDDELPEFDKVEQRDGETLVWWGSTGHYLGSATSGGRDGRKKRDPGVHRSNAIWGCIEGEMTFRADRKFLENGDRIDGIRLAAKVAD